MGEPYAFHRSRDFQKSLEDEWIKNYTKELGQCQTLSQTHYNILYKNEFPMCDYTTSKQYQGPTEVKKHESVTKAISTVLLIFKIV